MIIYIYIYIYIWVIPRRGRYTLEQSLIFKKVSQGRSKVMKYYLYSNLLTTPWTIMYKNKKFRFFIEVSTIKDQRASRTLHAKSLSFLTSKD